MRDHHAGIAQIVARNINALLEHRKEKEQRKTNE
jgi:hypothetical protein